MGLHFVYHISFGWSIGLGYGLYVPLCGLCRVMGYGPYTTIFFVWLGQVSIFFLHLFQYTNLT